VEGRLSRDKAGTLGFLAQTMMHSHREIALYRKAQHELKEQEERDERQRIFNEEQDARAKRIAEHYAAERQAAEEAEAAARKAEAKAESRRKREAKSAERAVAQTRIAQVAEGVNGHASIEGRAGGMKASATGATPEHRQQLVVQQRQEPPPRAAALPRMGSENFPVGSRLIIEGMRETKLPPSTLFPKDIESFQKELTRRYGVLPKDDEGEG
jgi:DNA polymerase II small subunit/DNA polymerase delta subunit B